MRKVEVYKRAFNPSTQKTETEKVQVGKFHQFGCDFEEFETGAVNFTTAVVEYDDGTVVNMPVQLIKFVD